jgi:hypothetical protein
MNSKLWIGLMAGFIFGIVDVFNIYFAEDIVHPYLEKKFNFDKMELSILTGSLAIILSIMTAVGLERLVESEAGYIKNPFIEVVGIVTGTIFFLALIRFVLFLQIKITKIENKLIKHLPS